MSYDILHGMSLDEYTEIIRSRFGSPALPHLTDKSVRSRVTEYARNNGITDRLKSSINPNTAILASPRSAYREYNRSGNRQISDTIFKERMQLISDVALACYIGLDFRDYLQDLIWAECETTWWVMTAHQNDAPLDLWSTGKALDLSNMMVLLGEELEDEVKQRVSFEIDKRVLSPYLSQDTSALWWRKCTNNWNSVCHAGIGIASLLLEKDVDKLTATMRQIIVELPNFIDGFTDDGGCTEGPSYWNYGFGWYLKLAEAMYHYTSGKVNIMQGEKMRRICEYPFAVKIKSGVDLTFADASSVYMSVATASRINLFFDMPELYGLCRISDGNLLLNSLDDLLLYDGRKAETVNDVKSYYLPSLEIVKFKSAGITLGAKAGNNDEHHNHNDVGTFILHTGNTSFITDLGHPIYTARTFSQYRYESVFTNSFGHNVPVINGEMQKAGKEYKGNMTVAGLDGDEKIVEIDMTAAYDIPALHKLCRTLRIDAEGVTQLTDQFEFTEFPTELEEAFISEIKPAVTAAGTIELTSADGTAEISATTKGFFTISELTDARKDNPRNVSIYRISFVPDELHKSMVCGFTIKIS